ncbi:uncharacterized protein K489DRAFT_13856 [Dissoconium aciculare CBS 342.82]|uniref:Uncharacterized protein n=1 Tax=Dissoconium aciculare CBS 342.82 TaxID=1314786 RepID=A0A6J3MHJ9_9PEZI|nr:uncharacterized protein K489DRAFT_13856 [Dissoconium aciculare CBS 342.82]KAF1827358.1 hypothetical protein K489DRAFT_13856 [Dissoconium aciculare CBS 342.82]
MARPILKKPPLNSLRQARDVRYTFASIARLCAVTRKPAFHIGRSRARGDGWFHAAIDPGSLPAFHLALVPRSAQRGEHSAQDPNAISLLSERLSRTTPQGSKTSSQTFQQGETRCHPSPWSVVVWRNEPLNPRALRRPRGCAVDAGGCKRPSTPPAPAPDGREKSAVWYPTRSIHGRRPDHLFHPRQPRFSRRDSRRPCDPVVRRTTAC